MRRVGWLVALWVVLWGQLTVANVAGGVLVALGVIAIAGRRRPGHVVVRPLRALRFIAYFLYKLVEASVIVAYEVLTPRHHIRTGIVAVPLRGGSDALVTLIADAISLTPGTLTLTIDRERPTHPTLYVHVLHLRDVESVRRSVRRLEVLAVRAFGSAAALDGLRHDDSETLEAT
jgi:multicomponent Na+:H+ antiporter subunit E